MLLEWIPAVQRDFQKNMLRASPAESTESIAMARARCASATCGCCCHQQRFTSGSTTAKFEVQSKVFLISSQCDHYMFEFDHQPPLSAIEKGTASARRESSDAEP